MVDVGNDAEVSISFNWDSCDSLLEFRDGLGRASGLLDLGDAEIS